MHIPTSCSTEAASRSITTATDRANDALSFRPAISRVSGFTAIRIARRSEEWPNMHIPTQQQSQPAPRHASYLTNHHVPRAAVWHVVSAARTPYWLEKANAGSFRLFHIAPPPPTCSNDLPRDLRKHETLRHRRAARVHHFGSSSPKTLLKSASSAFTPRPPCCIAHEPPPLSSRPLRIRNLAVELPPGRYRSKYGTWRQQRSLKPYPTAKVSRPCPLHRRPPHLPPSHLDISTRPEKSSLGISPARSATWWLQCLPNPGPRPLQLLHAAYDPSTVTYHSDCGHRICIFVFASERATQAYQSSNPAAGGFITSRRQAHVHSSENAPSIDPSTASHFPPSHSNA